MSMARRLLLLSGGAQTIYNPAAPVPILGNELLANADLSAWTGGVPDGWTVGGAVPPNIEITEVGDGQLHGGAGTGNANYWITSPASLYLEQSVLTPGQMWLSAYPTIGAAATGGVAIRDSVAATLYGGYASPGAGRPCTAIPAGAGIRYVTYLSPTNITAASFSCRAINLASMIATHCQIAGPISGAYECTPRYTVADQVNKANAFGLMLHFDNGPNPTVNPTGALIVAYWRTGIYAWKYAAGSYTLLTAAGATYGDNRPITVIKESNRYSFYYNRVKVGATVTINDAFTSNPTVGLFGTTVYGAFGYLSYTPGKAVP